MPKTGIKGSIYERERADGTLVYKMHWRYQGRQKTLTFETLEDAERHRLNLAKFGHERAMEIIGVIETHTDEYTLRQMIDHHIDSLTGVEPGTIKRYRSYADNDLAGIGQYPLSAIAEPVIAAWVTELVRKGNSGKTIANKHGLVSAALNRAVRENRIPQNPCEHTRLPRKDRIDEAVFLSRDDFDALWEVMPAQWRPLTTWLVATGMRFSEATALTVGSVSVDRDTSGAIVGGTVAITKAWKWTGTQESRLSYPKSRAGRRTINVPPHAIAVLDLDRPKSALLFTNANGDRVTYSRYYDGGWKVAMDRLPFRAAPHDLRHTCASWMIAAGIPLPVIQYHLGHESITITVGTYGHLDRTSHAKAAEAIGRMLG